MKIVIKATHIAEGGGLTHINKMIEWFGKLAPKVEFLLVGKSGQEEMFIPPPKNFTYKFHRFPSLNIATRLIWDRFIFHRILKKTGSDLLFEPGNTGTMNASCPKVSLVHNIAPFDEHYCNSESLYQKFRNRALQNETVRSIKSSAGVIMLSEYCDKFFDKYIERSRTKTAVIYHGKPEYNSSETDECALDGLGIRGEFLLSVSHIWRYKKLKELVQAYFLALELNPHLPTLIHAGTVYDEKYYRDIIAIVKESKFADKVLFLGQVDPVRLQALYRNCQMFIFPSVLETCSIILIEALANGCAMACSNKSVVPEICGDAAEYFDPEDVSDIARVIIKLSEDKDYNTILRGKARRRGADFSWEKTASESLRFFEEIVKDNREKTTEWSNQL
ncbi:MAG: glycosyltransferase family 4 protein [candidate division Zixibacteria bacterium]|nr:glycosyltransferase family 4 protein [candidate division Zixibacteria bacterium]